MLKTTPKTAPQIKPKEAIAKELATAAPKETREQMAREALKQIATVTAVVGTPGALDAFAFEVHARFRAGAREAGAAHHPSWLDRLGSAVHGHPAPADLAWGDARSLPGETP